MRNYLGYIICSHCYYMEVTKSKLKFISKIFTLRVKKIFYSNLIIPIHFVLWFSLFFFFLKWFGFILFMCPLFGVWFFFFLHLFLSMTFFAPDWHFEERVVSLCILLSLKFGMETQRSLPCFCFAYSYPFLSLVHG